VQEANISVNQRIGADPEPLMRTDLLRSAQLPALERFILLSDLFYGLEVAPVFEIGDQADFFRLPAELLPCPFA